jgi:hypothetical protein
VAARHVSARSAGEEADAVAQTVIRHLVVLAGALLVGLGGCYGSGQDQPHGTTAAAGPIVLIVVDTLRADHLPCYGYGRPTAPAMCGLQADGVRFSRAYAARTVTTPSIASMLTGLYPYRHGLRQLYQLLPEATTTLAEVLRAHGWGTGGFVSSFVMVQDFSGLQQGFEVYDDRVQTREAFRENYERPATATVDALLAWLDTQTHGPHVFAFLHLIEPHGPYLPAEPHLSRFALPAAGPPAPVDVIPPYQRIAGLHFVDEYVGRYDGEIASADAQIDRVLDALRARGWYDAATIALVADHGESMGEGGVWFAHGKTVDDAEARVPLIIKFPRTGGGAPPRDNVDTPVSTVDLFPTLLAAAGVVPLAAGAIDLRAVAAGAARPAPAPITELPRHNEQLVMQSLTVKAHGRGCSVQWTLSGAALQPGHAGDPPPPIDAAGEAACGAALADSMGPLLRDMIDFRRQDVVHHRRDMRAPGHREAFVTQRERGTPLADNEREALRQLGYLE